MPYLSYSCCDNPHFLFSTNTEKSYFSRGILARNFHVGIVFLHCPTWLLQDPNTNWYVQPPSTTNFTYFTPGFSLYFLVLTLFLKIFYIIRTFSVLFASYSSLLPPPFSPKRVGHVKFPIGFANSPQLFQAFLHFFYRGNGHKPQSSLPDYLSASMCLDLAAATFQLMHIYDGNNIYS